ncbi:MAG: glycosyltransferase [Fibrobacterota bacterium]
MEVIAVITLISAYLYVAAAAAVLFFSFFRRRLHSEPSEKVSVIIPARNEGKNIGETLYSLRKCDYKPGFEIMVVNDSSGDDTVLRAREALSGFPEARIINTVKPSSGLSGKQSALDTGIKAASYEHILLTDADCIFKPDWIKGLSDTMAEGADLAFGLTESGGRGLTAGLEKLDLSFLFLVAVSFSEAGIPFSCMGNNVGIRKSFYMNFGGFKKNGYSAVEDFQLMRTAVRLGASISFDRVWPPAVKTATAGSFFGYLKRRLRWLSAVRESAAAASLVFLLCAAHAAVFWSPTGFFVYAADATLFYRGLALFGVRRYIALLPVYLLFQVPLTALLFILRLSGLGTDWKDRKVG